MKKLFAKNDNKKVIDLKSIETKAKIRKIRDKALEGIDDIAKMAVGTVAGLIIFERIMNKDNSEA